MYFVQIAPDAGNRLHTVPEVLESFPDKFIGEIIGIGDREIGLVDFL